MQRCGLVLGVSLVLYALLAHEVGAHQALQFWRENAITCWSR